MQGVGRTSGVSARIAGILPTIGRKTARENRA